MAKKSSNEDIIVDAQDAYKAAQDFERDNRDAAEADLRFARLGEQWDEAVAKARQDEGRPCLTINRMVATIRQVVNDARLNKPAIKVRPVDSGADVETAKIYTGIIRHIEQASCASVAYDTAIDMSTSCGFGYMRLALEYVSDGSFDVEPRIQAVENPFSIYGDPWSTKPDGSDWNCAFVVDNIPIKQYQDRYPKADEIDWDTQEAYSDDRGDDGICIAEYWKREEVQKPILLLDNGIVVEREIYEKQPEIFFDAKVVRERSTTGYKVIQRIMSGAEVLEEDEWAGRYIPIIPVYGERVMVDGKLYLRSAIRDAKDPQRMFNYWRSASTELVALAPKNPYIGPQGAFDTDTQKWQTAHTKTWPFIEYDGDIPPQRQQLVGIPAGMIQEALSASDDIKATTGIYDASLGARSNETSGVAINARDRAGDVSTFHFADNLARGISYLGRQLIDIIPKVNTAGRMVRILGEDGTETESVMVGPREQSTPEMPVFDLQAGTYDLVVAVGPSFTTKREEASTQMMELLRTFPAAAPVIGDLVAKNLDWPGAEEIAERLKKLIPGGGEQGPDPQMQKIVEQLRQATQELQGMKADKMIEVEKLKIEVAKLKIDEYKAQTDRLKVEGDLRQNQVNSMEQPVYGN